MMEEMKKKNKKKPTTKQNKRGENTSSFIYGRLEY